MSQEEEEEAGVGAGGVQGLPPLRPAFSGSAWSGSSRMSFLRQGASSDPKGLSFPGYWGPPEPPTPPCATTRKEPRRATGALRRTARPALGAVMKLEMENMMAISRVRAARVR